MEQLEQLDGPAARFRDDLRSKLDALPVRPLRAYSDGRKPRQVTNLARLAARAVAVVLAVAAAGVIWAQIGADVPGSAVGSQLVARNLDAAARMSQVIVVGTVVSEGGIRNTARDPKDPSRPDSNMTIESQDYVLEVEESLKGSVASQITVTSARSGQVRRGFLMHRFDYTNFVPLDVGARYVLLLQTTRDGVYSIATEPGRFELNGQATARSTWSEARTLFPDRPAEDFLRDLRAAIAAAR